MPLKGHQTSRYWQIQTESHDLNGIVTKNLRGKGTQV